MSHHYSGPDYGFPHGDARLDLTDLYAFPKPEEAGKSIVVMNVHPSVSVEPSAPTTDVPFASEAIYELKIDTDGDAIADIAYRILFSPYKNGAQTATVRRVVGSQAAGTSDDGQTIIEGAPVSMGPDAGITEAGDYRFFAGWRSDPFFFDTLGALNNLQFTGDDFFTHKDVCCIVLELPNSAFEFKRVGLWHRTLYREGGKWIQADRGALPSQSIFLTGDEKAGYLAGDPADDARFIPVFAHSLEHSGGYAREDATRVAKSLLPDILYFDSTQPASYPCNGRKLSDDVMDVFLSTITNGKVPSDNVGPHNDLLASFPYVGKPHTDHAAEGVVASQKPPADWNKAKRELTGATDMDPKEELLESAPDSERWDPLPGSTGHKVEAAAGEDEDAEGRSDNQILTEQGMSEAELDEAKAAAKQDL